MSSARRYQMTVWTGAFYDEMGRRACSVEAHFMAALEGSIHENRAQLRELAAPVFQDFIRERYGESVPKEKIKIRFEREESALSVSRKIRVDFIEMVYRGDRVVARPLGSQVVALDDEETEDEETEEEEEDRDVDEDGYEDDEDEEDEEIDED